MKTLLLLTLLAVLPASGARASSHDDCPTVSSRCCDDPARWARRHDVRDARLAVDTENGDATLLITDEVVALQLSERDIKKLKHKLRETEDEKDNDNLIGHAIKLAILSSLGDLFDHSAECPVRNIRNVDYRHGRLAFTSDRGKPMFEDISVGGHDVLGDLSEHDAQAFVKEFRRVKSRTH
jgi:hypothetical protein